MMMNRKSGMLRLLVIGLMLLFAVGCASTRGGVGVEWGGGTPGGPGVKKAGPPPHAPAHGYRAKHRYRYYPEREVYFDIGRRLYFYIEGEVWKSGISLPYHLRMSLGDYETVELDDDTPYEYHQKYKKHKVPPGKQNKQKKG